MKQIYIQLKSKKLIRHSVVEIGVNNCQFSYSCCEKIGERLCKGPPGSKDNLGMARTYCLDNIVEIAHQVVLNRSNVPKQIYNEQTFNYLLINKSNHSLIFKFFLS